MNTEEHKEYLKEFKEFAKTLLKSKEDSTNFLISAGIITKDGDLTDNYKNSESIGFKYPNKK